MLRESSLHALSSHDLLLLLHASHAIRVHLSRIGAILNHLLHVKASQSLLLADGTILVSKEKRLQVDDLISQGIDLRVEGIILRREDLNFVLQVGEPLLLSLSALQCGHPGLVLDCRH
jgi:hypothetical protein